MGMVGTHGLETSHADTFSSSISREGTLMIREVSWYKNCEEEVLPYVVFISELSQRMLAACIFSIVNGGGEPEETRASKWLSDFSCPPPSFLYPSKLPQCDLITLVRILQ